jgi:hypothetical protein
MKSESDPITDDEWLLRRVRYERFRTDTIPLISPNAFEPRLKGRDVDKDGISFYRQACLASPEEILATVPEEKRHEFGIVRVSVALIRSLGFAVESRPDSRVRGHVTIPEMNASDYAKDKARFIPIKLRLAEEASKETNILRYPQNVPRT